VHRIKTSSSVLLVLLVPVFLLLVAAAANAQSPRTIRYDGRLEQNGRPADGGYDLGFALFDAAQAGNQLWPGAAATYATIRVTVSNGQFVVELGGQGMEPLGWQVFAAPQVFVQTQVNGTALNGRRAIGAVPFAVRAENGVPVGGLMMWWRPNAQFPVPDGFAIADGRVVDDALSPLNGMVLPNMMNRAPVGLPDARNGEMGGSNGAVRTTAEGVHRHIWATWDGRTWRLTWNDGNAWTPVAGYPGDTNLQGGGFANYPLMLQDRGVRNLQTDDSGLHAHTVPEHIHPYIGLLPLIRTR
jgi:hypothetical protein